VFAKGLHIFSGSLANNSPEDLNHTELTPDLRQDVIERHPSSGKRKEKQRVFFPGGNPFSLKRMKNNLDTPGIAFIFYIVFTFILTHVF